MRERRVAILDAAARLIDERGFAQTTVDDVIQAAALSGKSHFYHYFRSKEELGYAVVDRQFERFAAGGLAVLRETGRDPLPRLEGFIDALAASHAHRGCRGSTGFGKLAWELADTHEGFRCRIASVFERWAGEIEALFDELRPRLAAGTEPRRLARFVVATLEGALMMSSVARDTALLHGIAEELKEFVRGRVPRTTVPGSPTTERGRGGAEARRLREEGT